MSSVTDFAELFAGREDRYGGEGGYCVKSPLTKAVWRGHLFGDHPIGVYPLLAASEALGDEAEGMAEHAAVTGWCAIDVDFDDRTFAFHLAKELTDVGLACYVESSRSKGWHVWVFWSDWCDARVSRSILVWLVTEEGHPKMEVYPKQWDTSSTGLGNYLRLPYPRRHLKTGRQVMHSVDGEVLSLDTFMKQVQINDPAEFQAFAETSPYWPENVRQVEVPGQCRTEGQGFSGGIQQEAALYLNDPDAVIPKGHRDNTVHCIAKLMAALDWDEERQVSTMQRIVNTQMEGRFPMRVALEKVQRANRERSRLSHASYQV